MSILQVLKELETYGQIYGPHLLPILLQGTNDGDDEVANNAIFGMGIICQFASDQVKLYPLCVHCLPDHGFFCRKIWSKASLSHSPEGEMGHMRQ